MQAYYAGAISLEILGGEQKRVDTEIHSAEGLLAKCKVRFDDLKDIYELTLWLARNCSDGYMQAPGRIRRQIYQAMLSNIFVDEDVETGATEVVGSALAEPFGSITAFADRPTLPTPSLQLGETKTAQDGRVLVPGTFYVDQGSDDNTLVQQVGKSLHQIREEIARWRDILEVPYREFLLRK